MARQRHTMTTVRWTLLALGTTTLALVFLATTDITARFTASFAYASGLAILLISERIIVSTRTRPETLLANARQGSIDR